MPHATAEEPEYSGSEDEASFAEIEVQGAWDDFVSAAGRDVSEQNDRYDRLRSAMLGLRNSGERFWMSHDAFVEHVRAAQRRRELPEGFLPVPVSAQPDRLVGGVVTTAEGRRGAALVAAASQSFPRNGGFATQAPPGPSVAQAARRSRDQAAHRSGGDRGDTAGQRARTQLREERTYRRRSSGTGSSGRSASPRPR